MTTQISNIGRQANVNTETSNTHLLYKLKGQNFLQGVENF